jgi:regulator of nucleoside diphosphate kinase
MPHDACTLTTKDFTILEVMLDRCPGAGDPMRALLVRKINGATVVFRDDIPPDVATLSSRVTFTVDGREPDTRIISHDRMTSPLGLFLPITTLRGLALLGLSAGEAFGFAKSNGEERVVLEQVLYQPESARRERDALARLTTPAARRSLLRVIPGTRYGHQAVGSERGGVRLDDDPGPSAACD